MKPLISVILPIYNVAQFLPRCIESVCSQTYDNLEIILVDDGSPDDCGDICDKYAEKDNRIVVVHKQNGGLSDARNKGAEIANGEYITFIDSDDYVTDTYVEYLYSLIEKYHTRMSLCTHTVVFENGKNIVYGNGGDEELSTERCLERMLYDVLQIYFLIHYKSQYFYMLRSSSIVYQEFNMKKLELLEMTDIMAKDVLKEYPQLKIAVQRRQLYARFSTLNQFQNVKGHKNEKKELISYIRMNKGCVLGNPNAPKRDKFAVMALGMGYPVYRLCWKLAGK